MPPLNRNCVRGLRTRDYSTLNVAVTPRGMNPDQFFRFLDKFGLQGGNPGATDHPASFSQA